MSPTSYQAAPPRVLTIAEVCRRVKLPSNFRLARSLYMSSNKTPASRSEKCVRYHSDAVFHLFVNRGVHKSQISGLVDRQTRTSSPSFPKKNSLSSYQSLYGVPSNGEVLSELECTSTMPDPIQTGLSTTTTNCRSKPIAVVIRSLGTIRRYPAPCNPSMYCGAD